MTKFLVCGFEPTSRIIDKLFDHLEERPQLIRLHTQRLHSKLLRLSFINQPILIANMMATCWTKDISIISYLIIFCLAIGPLLCWAQATRSTEEDVPSSGK